ALLPLPSAGEGWGEGALAVNHYARRYNITVPLPPSEPAPEQNRKAEHRWQNQHGVAQSRTRLIGPVAPVCQQSNEHWAPEIAEQMNGENRGGHGPRPRRNGNALDQK